MSEERKPLKTKLHHYSFPSISHPAYNAMVREIEANKDGRGPWMNAHDSQQVRDRSKDNTVEEVEIDTEHIFDNQLNTTDGRRVFDWYEEWTQMSFRRGHWLEITPEIAALRRATLKCGFCGKHYGPFHDSLVNAISLRTGAEQSPIEGFFCAGCLDSEYLKPADFKLLRLLPIVHNPYATRTDLTEVEHSELMRLYIVRQTTGDDSRANAKRHKWRAKLIAEFEQTVAAATEERDGMLWLWDRNISLDNVIYYNHTRTFSFGWRSPIAQEVVAELRAKLVDFPFQVEIKTTK